MIDRETAVVAIWHDVNRLTRHREINGQRHESLLHQLEEALKEAAFATGVEHAVRTHVKKPVTASLPVSEPLLVAAVAVNDATERLRLLSGASSIGSRAQTLRVAAYSVTQRPDDIVIEFAKTMSWLRQTVEQALGWVNPPLHLDAPCPACGSAALVVHFDESGPHHTICGSCNCNWNREMLADLAVILHNETRNT